MAATFGPVLILISTVLFGTKGTAAVVMDAAHNTTVYLRCIDPSSEQYNPVWYVFGGDYIPSIPSRDEDTGELIGTLIINGNRTCGTFNTFCRLFNGQQMHNITLTIGGYLPSPENVYISGPLVIEWDPPYTAINNNETSVMRVDPHITQYTVYILDNYTGNYIDKVNVTETSFTDRRNTSDDHSCPMYRVAAWNSGGEGDMSPPLPGATAVPNSVAADIRTRSGTLYIRLHVTDSCTVRMPNSFLVTVMSSTAREIIATEHVQQPVITLEHPVATVRVVLPQNVDECNLIVRIRAGNSAGMSSPTEITVGCQPTGPTTDPTTTTTANTGSITTSIVIVDQQQQGDGSIMYIAIGIPVGAVVIVATGVLLLIVLWKCKRTIKVEPPGENIYTKSPSCGIPPVNQCDSPPADFSISRTPSTESSDSSTVLLSPTAVKSGTQVTAVVSGVAVSLQSSTTSYVRPQASEGNPHQLVYALLDPTKHNRPQPPASDNQVQYAQIQY